MATTKITITLDEQELAEVRRLVKGGKAKNVSAFVQHAVKAALADVSGWGAMLALALKQTGGPLTASERAWADSVLKGPKPKRKRKAA